MNKPSSTDKIEVIPWLNGKEKEYSFKLTISLKNCPSLIYLKELILKTIISCKELNSTFSHLNFNQIHTLYNQKEIPLEDNDIQYLKNNEIIFFTFDSSSFKSSNHFNQYQFIRWIKSGGYGQVFLANHVYTKKEYAIKQINTTGFSNEDLYNISREHLILRSMIHKNVIRCYDSFAHDNKFYTVMDFAEGGELSVLLKDKGILPESEAKTIFKQIYDAVCYIHGQNIIHRDLKPNNILFLDKEKTHIVIIDFGISGMANGNQREKIKAGTTSFLPPEIASGEEYSSNPKIDIWALGIILYLMVQGCYPFEGKTTKDIIKSILRDKLEFNKKIKISAPLKTLIGGMLEKNYRFRIDDDADLFDKWFNYTGPAIKRKKTMDEKNIKKKTENHFNYLTPTKSTALKRLPTHSYNNFYQIQKQNLMSKFKDNNGSNKNINNINNINNIKVGTNNGVLSSKKIERKHSLFLPLLEKEKKQKNNNASINNEINGFRKQYKKNVEQNHPNTSEFQINLNGNKNSNEINEDIKENNNNKDEISENIEKEDDDELTKNLYKTKLNFCKQIKIKKKFL